MQRGTPKGSRVVANPVGSKKRGRPVCLRASWGLISQGSPKAAAWKTPESGIPQDGFPWHSPSLVGVPRVSRTIQEALPLAVIEGPLSDVSSRSMRPLFVLAVFFLFTPVSEEPRREAPSGYRWQSCPETKVELLVPDGWRLLGEAGASASTCTLAPEAGAAPLQRGTPPEQAVVVTLLRGVPEKSGMPADLFAARLTEELSQGSPDSRRSSSRQDPFFAYRVEMTLEENGKRFRLYHLAFANPVTGSVYLVSARAPESQWPRFWKKVLPVLKQLGLDPES